MPVRILNQFRRIYNDDGRDDVDFTDQEAKLRVATKHLLDATRELVRASERLNAAALRVGYPMLPKGVH